MPRKKENFSATSIPRPRDLVEPKRAFLVVTRGDRVGIFHRPHDFDLEHLVMVPGFSVRQFFTWRSAHTYYKECFEAGDVKLIPVAKGFPGWDLEIEDETSSDSDGEIVSIKRRTSHSNTSDEVGQKRKSLGATTRIKRTKTSDGRIVGEGSSGSIPGVGDAAGPSLSTSNASSTTVLRLPLDINSMATPASPTPDDDEDENDQRPRMRLYTSEAAQRRFNIINGIFIRGSEDKSEGNDV